MQDRYRENVKWPLLASINRAVRKSQFVISNNYVAPLLTVVMVSACAGISREHYLIFDVVTQFRFN
jgi:hypothetical protein